MNKELSKIKEEKKKKWYPQSFKKEWLKVKEFEGWLQRDENNSDNSYCICCSVSLKNANKSMLLGHSNSKKHKKNLEVANSKVKPIINFLIAEPYETEDPTPCTRQEVKRLRTTLSKSDHTLDTVARKVDEPIRKDDFGIDHFGSYVAGRLHSMDQRSAIITRKLINDVLFEAEMGNLNSSRVISTPQETAPIPVHSNISVSCGTNNSINTDSKAAHYFSEFQP